MGLAGKTLQPEECDMTPECVCVATYRLAHVACCELEALVRPHHLRHLLHLAVHQQGCRLVANVELQDTRHLRDGNLGSRRGEIPPGAGGDPGRPAKEAGGSAQHSSRFASRDEVTSEALCRRSG